MILNNTTQSVILELKTDQEFKTLDKFIMFLYSPLMLFADSTCPTILISCTTKNNHHIKCNVERRTNYHIDIDVYSNGQNHIPDRQKSVPLLAQSKSLSRPRSISRSRSKYQSQSQ